MNAVELIARIEAWSHAVSRWTRPLLQSAELRDHTLQLRRSSSGALMNYCAAATARSHADFTSKVGLALEEMDESWRWLRLLAVNVPPSAEMATLTEEARQLAAILGASHRTARKRRKGEDYC